MRHLLQSSPIHIVSRMSEAASEFFVSRRSAAVASSHYSLHQAPCLSCGQPCRSGYSGPTQAGSSCAINACSEGFKVGSGQVVLSYIMVFL